MIFSTDSGMSMMKDMAYIIIGGLVASTVLAMFLMPAFYLLIRRENPDGTKRKALFSRHKNKVSLDVRLDLFPFDIFIIALNSSAVY